VGICDIKPYVRAEIVPALSVLQNLADIDEVREVVGLERAAQYDIIALSNKLNLNKRL
jgi:hypothetical protein